MAGRIVMIGHPVAGVKLPRLFNARFERLGRDDRIETQDVRPEHLHAYLAAFREDPGRAGIIATAPHKRALAEFADRLGPSAVSMGLANALRRGADGRIEGEMFDGHAFSRCLADAGISLKGLAVAIIGFGAAGQACAIEARHAGASPIFVHDTAPAAHAGASRAGFVPWSPEHTPSVGISLLVNAAAQPLTEDYLRRLFAAQAKGRAITIVDLVARELSAGVTALSERCEGRMIDGSAFAAAQFDAIWDFLLADDAARAG